VAAPPPSMPPVGRVQPAKTATHPSKSELAMRVAIALCRGATLVTPRFTVGRYKGLGAPPDADSYACIDAAGTVVASPEVEERVLTLYARTRIERHDWSAAGAAKAFVENVPTPLVLGALSRARLGED